MIYVDSIRKLLDELRLKIQFRYEPNELKTIQQYIEATEALMLENKEASLLSYKIGTSTPTKNITKIKDINKAFDKDLANSKTINYSLKNKEYTKQITYDKMFINNTCQNPFSVCLNLPLDSCQNTSNNQINNQTPFKESVKDENSENLESIDAFDTRVISFLENFIKIYKNRQIPVLTIAQSFIVSGMVYGLLGKCLINGLMGLSSNHKLGLAYLFNSASCQCAVGTYELAKCYETGVGEKDIEKASQLYRASYKLGYIKGLHKYALILLKGNVYVEKNILDAFYILKQTIVPQERVYIKQYYDLGMLYISGIDDTFNDHQYAIKMFELGAAKGCRNCQYKLGEAYETGGVYKKSIENAFLWYRTSAFNNSAEGQYKIATMLYGIVFKNTLNIEEEINLTGTAKVVLLSMTTKEKMYRSTDLEAAIRKNKNKIDFSRFYKEGFNRLREAYAMAHKSALGGKKESVMLVAEALEKGFGVERNTRESMWWYKLAEKLGYDNLGEKLDLLERQLR